MLDGTANLSNDCCADSECDLCVNTNEAPLPLDFDQTSANLLALSLYWIDLPATEGATVEYLYQSLTLTCSSSNDFNHFSGVHLDGVTSVTINCPASSTVLIDYTIDTVSVQNLDFIFQGGVVSSHVIHHFCGSTLTVSGVNVEGTVFAPWSDVYFPQGLITGPVIAGAFVGSDDEVSEVSAAYNDECGKYGDGHAIISGPTGSMLFEDNPQPVFVQNDDGTATITGRARNGDIAFDVEMLLTGFSATAPADSPKLELKDSCYVSNGGSVDPSTWQYYEGITGTFTGVEGSTYEGAVVNIFRKGPSAQVGLGANGKNQAEGLSFWFDFETVTQGENQFPASGYGDFNLDMTTVENAGCPNGQINRAPFEGCCPTTQVYVCCQYQKGTIVNAFCAEDSCVNIDGWTLLTSDTVDNCDSCGCPQDYNNSYY